MKLLLFLFVLLTVAIGEVYAEPLLSASRWDISMKPYKLELQGELVRSIDDYRTAVNQTGIQPSRDRQMRAEKTRLELLLKSRGYYQSAIVSEWNDKKSKPKYIIEIGTRFTISSIDVKGNFQPIDRSWRSLKVGEPLSAVLVVGQQAKLKKHIETHSCYFNMSVDHRVELNQKNQSASVVFVTDVSEPTNFGRAVFSGFGDVNEVFLRRVSGIRDGDCYKKSAIDGAVISLFDTGLFSQVRPVYKRDSEGKVIVTFALERRKDRTLKSSIGWRSEQGFGGSVGWQHRDLFGKAQSLSLGLELTKAVQTVSANVVVPSFLDRRNRLNWNNEVTHSDLDIESMQYSTTAVIERKATQNDYYEFGIGFTQIDERVDDSWDSYRQFRLPLKYQYDSVRNPFNPATGFRASFEVEPVWDIDENFTPFILTGVGFQYFSSLNPRVTLANRIKWDSLWYGDSLGSTQDNIPESEWFTAGGSTSIRGYAYHSIQLPQKEISADNPKEIAAELPGATQRWLMVNELRLRLNDTWGFVGFWDVGAVGEVLNPLDQDLWYNGAGVGVRFFTRFAPIRFDMAFPLDRREQDDAFLLYVSLGQAF